jgi:hypothetical protein
VQHQAAPVLGKPARMATARVGVIRRGHGVFEWARRRRFASNRRARGSAGSLSDYRKRLGPDRTLVTAKTRSVVRLVWACERAAGHARCIPLWRARRTHARQIRGESLKTGSAREIDRLVRVLVLLLGSQVAPNKSAVNARKIRKMLGSGQPVGRMADDPRGISSLPLCAALLPTDETEPPPARSVPCHSICRSRRRRRR